MVFQVIGQKAQTPGAKWRQRRRPRQFQGRQQVIKDGKGVAPAHLDGPVPLQTDLIPFGAQYQERVPTHEGIAGAVQVAAAQEQHGIRPPPDGDEEVRQVLHPRWG